MKWFKQKKKNGLERETFMGFIQYKKGSLWSCLNFVKSSQRKICLILCNPFFDERVACYPYYAYYGRYLMEFGISSVRFDFLGTGESMPPADTYSLDKYTEQIQYVYDFVKQIYPFEKIGVLSVGSASLIVQNLIPSNLFDFCILWEPILKIKQYVHSLIRANILEKRSIYKKIKNSIAKIENRLPNDNSFLVGGYRITPQFINSINEGIIDKIENCTKSLRIECFKVSTYNTLYEKFNDKNKLNLSICDNSNDQMFWRNSYIKYPLLPTRGMKNCPIWIKSILT